VATNGVLNDSQTEWITRNLSGAMVSFDGLPAVHDRQRPARTGAQSSGRVIDTMRHFDEAGFGYGVRLTVLPDQVATLPDSVEFICSNFHPYAIQIEPVYQLGRWQDGPAPRLTSFLRPSGTRGSAPRVTRWRLLLCRALRHFNEPLLRRFP